MNNFGVGPESSFSAEPVKTQIAKRLIVVSGPAPSCDLST